jgi:hypothetical protein
MTKVLSVDIIQNSYLKIHLKIVVIYLFYT